MVTSPFTMIDLSSTRRSPRLVASEDLTMFVQVVRPDNFSEAARRLSMQIGHEISPKMD